MIESLLTLFLIVLLTSGIVYVAVAFFACLLAVVTRESRHVSWILPCASTIVVCVLFSLSIGADWHRWLPWRFPIMAALIVGWGVHGCRRMRLDTESSYSSLWRRSVFKSTVVIVCIFGSLSILAPHHHT